MDGAHLALVPGLFNHVAKIFRLWSAAKVEDLVEDGSITKESSISELIWLAHDLSASNHLFQSIDTLELSSITDLESARQHLSDANAGKQRCKLIESGKVIYFRNEFAQEMALGFVRLFVSLFTNFRLHGKKDSVLKCQIEVANARPFVFITLSNEAKKVGGKPKQGTGVIEKLVGRPRGVYKPNTEIPPLFIQNMQFAADCFTISSTTKGKNEHR